MKGTVPLGDSPIKRKEQRDMKWMRIASGLICVAVVLSLLLPNALAKEKVIYGFEKDLEGWEIPEWALEKKDHVGMAVERSEEFAKEGKASLKVDAEFPGKVWAGAVVEVVEAFDWNPYSTITCDVYLPEDAPIGLRGKIILTVGEEWKFTEMSRSIRLEPGKWTTLKASLLPGSRSWKRTVVDEDFRRDVRKVHVRIESNRMAYTGPIYIDNFILLPTEKKE